MTFARLTIPIISSVLILRVTSALPQFARKIPNGYSVPNPLPQGGVWAGVGHYHTGGGGELNPFGVDFAANNYTWAVTLCQTDSDGDGRTNGEELGDPNCVWQADDDDDDDPESPALSHPGIVDEPNDAETMLRSCDDYAAPEDELTMDITFSTPIEIDETQTHYACEQLLVDAPAATSKYHLVKTGVLLLDNTDTLHHMVVYICPTDGAYRVNEGHYTCSGIETGCRMVGGWAVGPQEWCEPPSVGIELDFLQETSSSRQVVFKLEAHYDNTSGQSQTVHAGMRLYLTPTLRPFDGVRTLVGTSIFDKNFVIPARQPNYELKNVCPTAITDHLEHAIFVYAFRPHMHFSGKYLVTELYRCGQKIGEVGRVSDFDFDNQQTYRLSSPIKILPGDTLVTTCGYDTSQVDGDIVGGEETTDEMCINFLFIYPHPGTDSVPNLFQACWAYENGLNYQGIDINQPLAVADADFLTVTTDFVTDPTQNIADCCATNSCEEIYLAEDSAACGTDADCMDGLICVGGVCQDEEANVSPKLPLDAHRESSCEPSFSFTSGFRFLVLAMLVAAAVFV